MKLDNKVFPSTLKEPKKLSQNNRYSSQHLMKDEIIDDCILQNFSDEEDEDAEGMEEAKGGL